MKYNFAEFEGKWQKIWDDEKLFHVKVDSSKPKYYCLEMLPYPSGNIHMGHVRNYSIGDVTARHRFMNGFNVIHPIGWDAFGLPAENAAKENNRHPAEWTYSNIDKMKGQLKRMGLSYDWSREISTCAPEYYKWEQMLFIKMWERGLAYKKKSFVNWCEKCETVLANEQVEDGGCWRCGTQVIQRELEQWFCKITDYAQELLDKTYEMPGWPEKVLTMQRNWIGRSEGAELSFKMDVGAGLARPEVITVFTTRPDTIYGVSFMSVAAEYHLTEQLIAGTENEAAAREFIKSVLDEGKESREDDSKEKKGFFTGKYCINPATSQPVPIYIANYVLMGYGTGAVMGVPAHDQRDYDFATKYKLPIVQVIATDEPVEGKATAGTGTMINSDRFNGLPNEEAKTKITEMLEAQGAGHKTINFRLRDWGVSRQRYWGSPVPFIHCDKCGTVPVPFDQLPVLLPTNVDFQAHGNPLDKVDEFVNVDCPKCGGKAKRDTDTMDTFMESSWYFLRYCSPNYDKDMFDKDEVAYWMPVDQYIGGVEHAVMHLLYARFYIKVLRDLGYVKFDEPFTNLLTQGMVCKETQSCKTHGWLYPTEVKGGKCVHCGQDIDTGRVTKMSKSKKNVVDPDELIQSYGADTIRLFSLFAAPPEKEIEWSESGVEGCYRFINRVYRLVCANLELMKSYNANKELKSGEIMRQLNIAIKRVSTDIDRFQYNTAVAAIMELVNALYAAQNELKTDDDKHAFAYALLTLLKLCAPFMPHLAEELWQRAAQKGFVSRTDWPKYDESFITQDSITVVVQINGKVRAELTLPTTATQEEALAAAFAHERVKFYTDGKTIAKQIYVAGKLVSLVVK